jgi:hypothetical protein
MHALFNPRMKKILFVTVASLALLIGCYKDQNNNCACNGALGTNFSELSVSFDSLCSAWKSAMCLKDWTCTCTLGAPTVGYSGIDSVTAVSNCTFYQQQLQKQYVYGSVQCTL